MSLSYSYISHLWSYILGFRYTREFDTLSINCYPEGGMTALSDAQYERAVSNDVEFYLEEPAVCIDRSEDDHYLYEVRTPNYKLYVREFLFIANNKDPIRKMNGDLIEEINNMPLTMVPKSASAATVMLQFDPAEPAWWYDTVDKSGGVYSFRTYGDLDCFSRLEILDTPYHRQHNAIRAVYSDSRCIDLWKELIDDAESTGDYSKLVDRSVRGLRHAYPDIEIPEPILAKGKFWDETWYFNAPLSTSTNEDVEEFGVNPFPNDEDERVCLVGDCE